MDFEITRMRSRLSRGRWKQRIFLSQDQREWGEGERGRALNAIGLDFPSFTLLSLFPQGDSYVRRIVSRDKCYMYVGGEECDGEVGEGRGLYMRTLLNTLEQCNDANQHQEKTSEKPYRFSGKSSFHNLKCFFLLFETFSLY